MSTPGDDLLHLFPGFRISQAIHAIIELGIPDLIGDEPRSVEDLATETGPYAPPLRRVLRLLASEGVFAETEDGQFALTPMASALRWDAPGSLRPLVRFIASETSWRSRGTTSVQRADGKAIVRLRARG